LETVRNRHEWGTNAKSPVSFWSAEGNLVESFFNQGKSDVVESKNRSTHQTQESGKTKASRRYSNRVPKTSAIQRQAGEGKVRYCQNEGKKHLNIIKTAGGTQTSTDLGRERRYEKKTPHLGHAGQAIYWITLEPKTAKPKRSSQGGETLQKKKLEKENDI